jgi:hypothetical protein
MASLQHAERARDLIAEAVLDGERVVSVGIRNDAEDYSVGVTATAPVEIPPLPAELADVDVSVRPGSPAFAQARSTRRRWGRRARPTSA